MLLVLSWLWRRRRRTVANVGSIGLVVRRCNQCSAGNSKKAKSATWSLRTHSTAFGCFAPNASLMAKTVLSASFLIQRPAEFVRDFDFGGLSWYHLCEHFHGVSFCLTSRRRRLKHRQDTPPFSFSPNTTISHTSETGQASRQFNGARADRRRSPLPCVLGRSAVGRRTLDGALELRWRNRSLSGN